MQRGQTTIELLLLLAVSMIALAMVYSLYSDQVLSFQASSDSFKSKASIQKIVDAANSTYLSGKESETKIFIEVPDSVDLTNSGFSGRSVNVRLANGSDIVGIADVNLVGNFKSNTGKYTMYLHYDGNVVKIEYRDFELNKQSVFVSVTQGSSSLQTFIIRNNTDATINFWIDSNFSHSLTTLNIASDDTMFSLNGGEIKTIDFNFEIDATAYGNYAGTINVIGQQNDINTTKNLYVSVESYLQISDLMIYPRTITESVSASGSHSQDYSICNHTSSSILIDDWIDLKHSNITFSDPSVSSVSALSCENFTIEFNFGAETSSQDANLTANYTDGNNYTTFMNFDVS